MYRCDICGTDFDEPFLQKTIENLDGENGIEEQFVEACPICGGQHFSRIKEDDNESL